MKRGRRTGWNRRMLALFLSLLMLMGTVASGCSVNTYAVETGQEQAGSRTETASQEENTEPEGSVAAEAESTEAASEEETAETAASAESATAEEAERVEAEAADPETGAAAQQAVNAEESASSGTAMDVTSTLIIDGGGSSVLAGQTFQLQIQYNVPELGSNQGNAYSGAYIQFTLPTYLQVDTDDDKFRIDGPDVTATSKDDYGIYTIELNDGESLTSNTTNTVTITLVTENLVTPNGTELTLDDFTFSVNYLASNDNSVRQNLPVPAQTVTVVAASDWQVEKTIVGGDAENSLDYVRVDDSFEVTYQVTVTDAGGVNRLGRLGFAEYKLIDTLPTDLPAGGMAVAVSDVKILHGDSEIPLEKDKDYTLDEDNGTITGITFLTLDTMQEGDTLGQYQKLGDVTDTTYQYTVRYPYKPYTTEGTALDITSHTLTNTVDLVYTLYGDVEDSKQDTATFVIAAYEDGVASADVSVEKYLSIGGRTYLLNSQYADIYGTAEFTLYTDEDCTTVAYNLYRQLLSNIAVDEDGIATFQNVRYGTYYLKETKTPDGFQTAAVVRVEIDESGNVTFVGEQTEGENGALVLTNTADTVGILEFTKKGNSVDDTNVPLAGAEFTLTDGTNTYTAVSGTDGKVVFYNIPAGTYTLSETGLSEALTQEGYTVSENTFKVTVKEDTVNTPELHEENIFLNDSPMGLLQIQKVDAQNNSIRLSGASFEVYGPYKTRTEAEAAISDLSEATCVDSVTTNNSGMATFDLLMEGFYVLLETDAPVNYTAGAPQVVEVTARETVTLQVENDPQAQVRFVKRGGASAGTATQELAGATFVLYDENEELLYGVKDLEGNFTEVSTEQGTGRVAVEITTYLDATNRSTSPSVSLSPGTYYYQETDAPAPYMADTTLYSFTVAAVAPASGSGTWNIEQQVSVVNILKVGQIRIVKEAEDGDNTSTALNGAVFGVYASEADAKSDTNRLDTITTGTVQENGVPLNGIGYSTVALTVGTTYYVKEISAPDGFEVNETIFPVTCTSNSLQQEVTCENKRTVSIQITKTDSVTSTVLPGAVFELYQSVSEGVARAAGVESATTVRNEYGHEDALWLVPVTDGSGESVRTATTWDNGILLFGDLSQETTYVVHEIQAPEGYAVNDSWYAVTTGSDASTPAELTITNERKGTLIVEKRDTFDQTDDQSTAFAGVTFSLYRVGDATAATWDVDDSRTLVGTKSTGADGTVSWDDLEPGDYWLVETLPDGYQTDEKKTESQRVTVTAGLNVDGYNNSDTVTITNTATMGKIQIGKYALNAEGEVNRSAPLNGVVFGVYKTEADAQAGTAEGQETTLTTGADGSAISGWLEPGTYYMKELTPAEGYVLSDVIYQVTVTANQITTQSVGGDEDDLLQIGNEKEGGFTIEKYGVFLEAGDSAAEVLQQLSGASFTLYEYDAEKDGSLTGTPSLAKNTDRNPVTSFTMESYTHTVAGLEPGVYWLRENGVVSGTDSAGTPVYDETWTNVEDMLIRILPDGSTQYGTIKDGTVSWSNSSDTPVITLKDYSRKPRIRFTKLVYGETTTIDGARFELYVVDSTNGEPTIIDGVTVYLSPVLLDANDSTSIVTIDSGTARDADGNVISGEAITPKLEQGRTYYLKEVSLEGYQNNIDYYFDTENCWTKVEIPADAGGEEYSVTIYNYRRTYLPGYKYSEDDTDSPLAGSTVAVFRNEEDAKAMISVLEQYQEWTTDNRLEVEYLYDDEGNLKWNIDQIATSNGNGQYTFSDLIPGETYYILEVVAPNGYQLEKDENGNFVYHEVVVNDIIEGNPHYGTTGTFYSVDGKTSVNELYIANWNFTNIVLDKISVFSGQEYRISNAVFTIYASTTDADGNQIPDTSEDAVVGYIVESNDSGQYMSNALPSGTYWFAETTVPEGFKEADREAYDSDNGYYDYVEIDNVRYYKVVLGRTENNTWFTEDSSHAIYNEANVGRFALTKVSSEEPNTKVKATFSIEKYDTEEEDFVKYEAYSSIETSSTDAYVLSNFLEPGLYRLTETGVDDNYTLNATPIYIEIAAGKITDGSNPEKREIDGDTVVVYRPVETLGASNADTGEDNTETADPISPITVTNVPKGRLWIHKTGVWGSETLEDLSGVTFHVCAKVTDNAVADMTDATSNGTIVTIETNEDGIAESGLLDAGDYWVIEVSVSEDDQAEYGKDSYTAFQMVVEPGVTSRDGITLAAGTNYVEVTNSTNYGKFSVTKKDDYSGVKLSGATLEIYTSSDCGEETHVGTMVDNEDGTYTSPLLPAEDEDGNTIYYWLKETEAPRGYYLPDGGIIFGGEDGYTVTENGINTVDEDEPITNDLANTLTIQKYEQEGEKPTSVPIQGVVFGLYSTEEAAQKATLEEQGEPVITGTTDAYGKITWSNLPDGTYYLKELSQPDGYVANTEVRKIVLDNTPEESSATRVSAYEETVYNLILGGIELDKTVTWENEDGSVPGSGITFRLYKGSVAEANLIATLTTDSNGRLSYRLEAGDYILVEDMSSDLYTKDSTQFSTNLGDGNYIDSEGNIHFRVEDSVINRVFTGVNAVNNIANYGRFQLMKLTKQTADDEVGLGISGAEYLLEQYNETTGTWEYAGTNEADSTIHVGSDEDVQGLYVSGPMTPGRYRVTETKAPTSIANTDNETVNFAIDPTPIEFTVTAGATVEVEQWDGILRTLRVTKTTDANNGGQPLAGVTFELWTYNEDADLTGAETDYDKCLAYRGTLVGTVETGADGVAVWQNLNPGQYVLVETGAPEGYVLTAQIVTIAESTSYLDVYYDLEVVNESSMGRIIIQKTDQNGNVICDDDGLTAVFEIYADGTDLSDPDRTPVTTVTVSGDGTGTSGLLPVGDYWVVEVQAPNGYPLDERLDQNILAKRVTVSGNQNPTADFTDVSPTATEGYTDLVIFQNRTEASVGTIGSSLNKDVRVENSGTSYAGTGAAHSETSLMNEAVSVWFLLSGLTDGNNDLPLTSFVVTDETMDFQGLTEGSTDSYYSYESGDTLTAEDYTFDQIRLYKSVNKSSTAVLATVEAKVNGQWQTVQADIDLTNLADNGYQTVELPEGATGFRVSYANAEAGFLAGNIEVRATFAQRPSDATAPEIRRITNTATLSWEDTAVDDQGNPAHQTGTVSDTASVTFSSYMENLPMLSLTNQITSQGSASGYYYSGNTVEFETVGSVSASSLAGLRHPVMSITLPPYTTLDEGLYGTAQGGIQGIRAILSQEGGSDEILTFSLSEPIQVTVTVTVGVDGDGNPVTEERTCLQYVLDFGEDFVLEPGQSITLQYGAVIDLSLPDSVITLQSYGYIGSGYQLPLTLENPTGQSYLQAPGDSSAIENSAAVAGAVGEVEGEEGLTCLRQPVSVEVTRSDSLQIYKSIGVEEGEWLSRSVTAEVEPGGTLYYQLSLVNAGDAVREIRFVDIIPFTGDTMELRSLTTGGSLSLRSTSLPVGDGYESVELLWVDGNPDGVEGVSVTVYYYVGGSWDTATRSSKTAAEELPMLASKAENVWGEGWTTTPPEDLSQVTAVGVEVTFEDGYYMEAGDVYNVTLAMRAPGYTADEMAAYEDAIIGNTTAAAVVRANDTETSEMLASDRVSSNEVLATLHMATGSLGDYAFYDNNSNGIQDEGDRPARNVSVSLYRRKSTTDGGQGQWELWATTTTDAEGKYLFEGLSCNYRTEESYQEGSGFEEDPTNPSYYVGNAYFEYRVEFDIPEGYGAAERYAGDDAAVDSNIDENGQTEPVSLDLTLEADGSLVGEVDLTIDAGFVSLVKLGDYVWVDSNKNGIQDESESGLNGVTVNLYQLESPEDSLEGREPYATQITATNDATGTDGYYCFTDLPKGLYVVEFDLSGTHTGGYTASYAFTTANAGSSGADSDAKYSRDGSGTVMYTDVIELYEDDMTWDAGVTVYSALGGFVFDDQDYDNTQSVYIPLPGTLVDLYTVGDDGSTSAEPIASTVVGEDGTYLFDRLEAGRYRLHFQYPEGYASVEAGVGDSEHDSEVAYFDDDTLNGGFTDIIELPADTADLTHDAGAYLLSSIGDFVWVDANQNGLQDEGEAPVSGVIVTLQQRSGDGEWETVSTAVTDETGHYLFTGLRSSEIYDVEYRVVFNLSLLAILTTPYQGEDTALDSNALSDYLLGLGYLTDPVKPDYGQSDLTIDAGIYYVDDYGAVGDYVWYDVNQDGVQDADETGVEGITVILQYNAGGDVWDEDAWQTVATTITNSQGLYLFDGLPSGFYRVGFAVGEPWTVTLTNQGDSATDSNATVQGDGYYFSMSFFLNPGQTDLTWDAGLYRTDDVQRPTTITTIINRVVTGIKTGDPTMLGALLAVMAVSGGMVVFLVRRRRKKMNAA